ncbi:hypothetical protein J2785_007218 [Burkholderia ambifaria]|nr:hypothetical protein [Burkholderia ambifaria]MDR6504024.1 hypothetical protein [Burkholderia ambifaria]
MNIQGIGGGTRFSALQGGDSMSPTTSNGIGNASRSTNKPMMSESSPQSTVNHLMSRASDASTDTASNVTSNERKSVERAEKKDSNGMDFLKQLVDMLRSLLSSLMQMFTSLASMLGGLGR